MNEITFEQLPRAVTQLFDKVDNIERLLLEKSNENLPEPDRWFDLKELCEYLPDKPAHVTAYSWVSTKQIPYHKGTKKLRFLKSEIDAWLKQGRRKTLAETAIEANAYLKSKRGKL